MNTSCTISEDEEKISNFRYNIDHTVEVIEFHNTSDAEENLTNQNKRTIRMKMQTVLNSNYFQWLVIILVLLDTLCVSGELVILIENNKQSLPKLKTFHEILKYSGISILAVFLIEIIIKIVFATKEFFHSKLEIFDSFVVVISFVLDITFFNHDASSAFELITLLRLWRIGRIINGTIIAVETREDLKRKKLVERINKLKNSNLRLLTEIMKRDAIINQYKISNSI